MQKLAKRTLAFLLVVSMLCGMMVMTASAITATPESDGSYYYDFTVASHSVDGDGVVKTAMPWISYTSSTNTAKFIHGWGERNIFALTAPQIPIWESYYNTGKWSYTIPEDATTDPAGQPTGKITYTANLTWLPLVQSNGSNLTTVGGWSSTAANPSYRGYDGLQFISRKEGTSTAKTNEWIALQLKAPSVGKYSVELDYTKLTNGCKSAALYLLPGAATAEQIEAAIANDTGKLGSVDFSGSGWQRDKNIALNDILCDTPAEAYTLVLYSELNKNGTTDEGVEARAVIDGLRLTPAEEELPGDVVYDLGIVKKDQPLSGANLADATTAAALDEKYATNGWDYLGTTFTGNATIVGYSAIYGYLQFMTSGTNGYVAFKLKSPGEGTYKLDMTGNAAGAPNADPTAKNGATTHLWMDAYIVKLDATMDEANYAQYLATAEKIGTYDPAYKTFAEQAQAADPTKLDYAKRMHTDEITAGYEFEAGAEYILYLQRSPEADTTQDTKNNNYSPANAYISCINATFVPKTVATIGKDYTPPADKDYVFTRRAEGMVNNYAATTGTLDSTEGGYPITTTSPKNVTVTYGDKTLTGKTLAANWAVLRYGNSTAASGGNVYWFNNYNADTATATMDVVTTINYNLKRFLDSNYNTSGWQLLGSSVANNGLILNDGYMQAYTIDKDNYVAFKLQSPGTGDFELDMKVYHPTATGDVEGRHMGMLIYIVEADKAVYSVDDSLKITATLPETPNAVYAPAYKTGEAEAATVDAPLVDFNDPTKSFTYSFEEGKEYIVYIVRDNRDGVNYNTNTGTDVNGDGVLYYTPNNMYLNGIYAKSISEATTAEKFTTLNAALDAAAEAGETVYLQSDILQGSVSVPEGVTLDLNGYKLTTSAFSTVEGGKITDSVGTGLLNTTASGATFLGDNPLAENTLPIYDAAKTGYRFFDYSYNAWGTDDDALYDNGVDGAVRFWYQIIFADAEAYDLIATGNSGVQLGVNVNLNGEEVQKCVFKYADETEGTWMQAWASAKAAWLWVRIQDAADIEGLSIAPVITAGGLDIELAEIESVQQ